jgi:hypothetical protein
MFSLLSFLGNAIAAVFAYIIASVTKKGLVTAAVITAIAALILGLTTALNEAIEAITVQKPGGIFHQAFGLLPSNLPSAFTAILSFHAIAFVYRLKTMLVNITNQSH